MSCHSRDLRSKYQSQEAQPGIADQRDEEKEKWVDHSWEGPRPTGSRHWKLALMCFQSQAGVCESRLHGPWGLDRMGFLGLLVPQGRTWKIVCGGRSHPAVCKGGENLVNQPESRTQCLHCRQRAGMHLPQCPWQDSELGFKKDWKESH